MVRLQTALLSAQAIVLARAQLWNQTIKTTNGPVQGFEYFNSTTLKTYFDLDSANVTAFLGIPYGADTAYQNRWKPAQKPEPWNETLHATSFSDACPTGSTGQMSQGGVSEDCLSLNIWTNAGSASAKLPVMVWNQGSEEASDNTWWYGGGMALKDVILISFNRRDDAFGRSQISSISLESDTDHLAGYLAHPDLNQEGFERTGYYTSGNYGVLDQLSVLEWVKANIANFGGDPDRVRRAWKSLSPRIRRRFEAPGTATAQTLLHTNSH